MKYKTIGNCPYCDAELLKPNSHVSGWSGSQDFFAWHQKNHDANHPENEETEDVPITMTPSKELSVAEASLSYIIRNLSTTDEKKRELEHEKNVLITKIWELIK